MRSQAPTGLRLKALDCEATQGPLDIMGGDKTSAPTLPNRPQSAINSKKTSDQSHSMKGYLKKKEILAALDALNKKLEKAGTRAEICIYGGASMLLGFNARMSTKDVDAVFKPKDIVRKLIEEVAQEQAIPSDWMNDGVKGFTSANPKFTAKGLPNLSHIQVTRPTAKYLFAMKSMAARAPGYDSKGDKGDIKFLMKRLKIESEREAFTILEEFYDKSRVAPKSRFLVLECLQELGKVQRKFS